MELLQTLARDEETLKEFDVIIPEWKIAVLENAIITPSSSVYTRSRRVDYSLDTTERWKMKVRFFLVRELFSFLRRKKSRHQDVFFISDIWQGNYYHWFCEILPRILFFREYHREGTVLLSEQLKGIQFILDSLDCYQINPVWIRRGHGAFIRRMHLILTTPNKRVPQPYAIELVRKPLKFCENREKIYISRRKATRRRLLNEEEIYATLRQLGFKMYILEEMSFQEQKALFSAAKVVVAPHGAGLTNTIFAPKGIDVIELLSGNDVNPKVYRDLSLLCGHKYKAIIGGPTQDNFSDFSVNAELLLQQLAS